MGSFNMRCHLSGMTIQKGDRIKIIPVFVEAEEGLACTTTALAKPAGFALTGRYNEVGWIDSMERTVFTNCLIKRGVSLEERPRRIDKYTVHFTYILCEALEIADKSFGNVLDSKIWTRAHSSYMKGLGRIREKREVDNIDKDFLWTNFVSSLCSDCMNMFEPLMQKYMGNLNPEHGDINEWKELHQELKRIDYFLGYTSTLWGPTMTGTISTAIGPIADFYSEIGMRMKKQFKRIEEDF